MTKWLNISIVSLLMLLSIGVDLEAQSAGAFIRQGFGARGIGMGNALVADICGEASPFYNPALAPFVARQNIEVSQGLLTQDRTLQFLQFAAPLRPKAGVAVGLINAGVSGIDGRDNSGYHTQDYSVSEFASFLNFGAKVGSKAALGLGLRFYRSDLVEEIKPEISIGLSLGLAILVNEDFTLAFAVDDLLARYTWDSSGLYGDDGSQTSNRFPIRMRFGAGKRMMDKRLLILLEYESQFELARKSVSIVSTSGSSPSVLTDREDLSLQSNQFRIGAEYKMVSNLHLRGGIGQPTSTSAGSLIPSLGFSYMDELGQLGIRADYAFRLESYGQGSSHMIGVSILL